MLLTTIIFLSSFYCTQAHYAVKAGSRMEFSYGDDLRLSGTVGLSLPDAVGEIEVIRCTDQDHPNATCYAAGDFANLAIIPTKENEDGGYCLRLEWSSTHARRLEDCYEIRENTHLFGGAETYWQYWPVNEASYEEAPYLTADFLQDFVFGNIVENYWLTSTGVAVFVDEETPLFISYNSTRPNQLCFVSSDAYPYNARSVLELKYTVCVDNDIKSVHLQNFYDFYPKPAGLPDEQMLAQPLWSTWAQHRSEVNQSIMVDLARTLIQHGFSNSSHVEIDDKWETCYGQEEFDPIKFPDPKAMVDEIKEMGFRITLWVQPFINFECDLFTTGVNGEYFLKDQKGKTALTGWWGGSRSGCIDPTNPAAVTWWSERLQGLQSRYGFDSFKFDAGEGNWLPASVRLTGDENLWPNIYTSKYVEAVSSFGGMVEVRAGRHTQEFPIFTRIMDRDSHWGHNAGLKSVIPTILQFGILGYPFALPDMIGGTGFNPGYPTKELFIRWLEVNVFMPSVQFSVVPWDEHFDEETIDITRRLLAIREMYKDYIMDAARQAVTDGSPINRPMWWVDPTDPVTFTVDQQFMVGDYILVAPVVEEGALSRDIYLPTGIWRSVVTNIVHPGPVWLRNFTAELDVLPFFLRVDERSGML